ncbi:uncharacterized protein LOC134667542 [Cydia fagiglandana]|uniref:uncharacterized protein LOC134667542 n=1 Tax=Cydia fagiglandana TaxID=1458189 RepID=UPI002FEE0459
MAHSDQWKVLVKNFPCLYDPNNPHFLDEELKARCLEQLLEMCNKEGDEMDMETLKQRVSGLITSSSRRQLIVANNAKTDRFLEMAQEFPSLWDPRDLNYRNGYVRRLSYEKLLEKYNRVSPVKMTTEDLRKNIYNLTRRLAHASEIGTNKAVSRQLPVTSEPVTDRFLEMAREFPCLWDRRDLNFRIESVRKQCYKQFLEKYNRESSVPLTMGGLKRSFYNLTRRMKHDVAYAGQFARPSRPKEDPILELAQEFPYLWDSEHLNYRDAKLRRRGYKQLLEKYNKELKSQITVIRLQNKLYNMRKRLKSCQESRKKGRSSWKDKGKGRESETGESSSSPQQQTSYDLTIENSSDADPLGSLQEDSADRVILQGIEIVFNWCCFCGEIRNDCHQLTHDKPYVTTDKIILTMNDINVEVDFKKDTAPQTVCRSCDKKLQEVYEFVKLVKKTQDKFSNVSNIDDFRENPVIPNENPPYMSNSDGDDDDDDDKAHVIYESLSISDTEFINKAVSASKRKNNKEETATPRKKFRVSVDLNSMSSFCDDSNGSNYMNLNCDEEMDASVDASKETTREVNEVNESVTIKKEFIESASCAGAIADKEELSDTENAIQRTEKQQNTTTSYSVLRKLLASETNSVLDEETARESISAVTFAGYSLNIATEDVKTRGVNDNEFTHDFEKEIEHHTIRTQMRSSEVQKQVTSEINSILVTNKDLPKANTAEDRKKGSDNAETIIKQECIVLSDDTDDEDNNDVQPTTKTKLEPTEVQNTQVLVSDTSKLSGTQKELLNDTIGPNSSSVSVNQPSSEPVCVIPKIDLVALVESIVGRMLNK